MAYPELESVWKLMTEYTLEIEPDSKGSNLKCGICKKLMIDACQTVCGCQYCFKCLTDYLADGNGYCPGKKEDCNLAVLMINKHVIRNDILNKKILSTKVRCPNQFCACNIALQEINDHLRVCIKQLTECPYVQIGCDAERTTKDAIVSHLQNEMFAHSLLFIDFIHNLKNDFDGFKLSFENNQLKEQLTFKDTQLKEVIEQIDNQKQQMEEQTRNLECMKEESLKSKNMIMKMKETFGEKMKDMELKLSAMIAESKTPGVLARDVGLEMPKQIGDTPMEVQTLSERRMNNWIRWNKLLPNIDVDFVWRIDEFTLKRMTRIFSESFDSHNYKLCLSMSPNFLHRDDIYLRCHIMKGDNDDRVEWPMRLSVTIGIVNRETLRSHISQTTQYDSYTEADKSVFDRPKMERNDRICVGPSIKYSSIKDVTSIIVDDSIIVSCVIFNRL